MSESGLDPETETWRRDRPIVAAAVTVLAYACALVGAGHGIAPVGMLLVFAFQRETYDFPRQTLILGAVLGLAGIALVVAHLFTRAHRVPLGLGGVAALAVSLLAFSGIGDAPIVTLVTAVPFALAAAWMLRLTLAPAPPQPPPTVF